MELPNCILVDPTAVQCCQILVNEAGPSIRLLMKAIPPSAPCPDCAVPSRRIHSRYRRKLARIWSHSG